MTRIVYAVREFKTQSLHSIAGTEEVANALCDTLYRNTGRYFYIEPEMRG